MEQKYFSQHWKDNNGNPAGGVSSAVGINISWQNGPLSVDGVRRDPNGAFVETVIAMVIDRIKFYQDSKFASDYNARALDALYVAAANLRDRTKDREARGVEGTHKE